MKLSNNKGFTLVETMMALAIAMIFFSAIYQVMTAMTNSWYQNLAQMESGAMVKKAMNSMVKELKCAQISSVTTTGAQDNKSITFKVPYQTCDAGNSNCIWSYGADHTADATITYALSSRNLVRQLKDSTNALISEATVVNNVSALNFDQAINDAFIQGGSGTYLDLNTDSSKPKTYNIQLTYQARSAQNQILSSNLTSRVTVQNI